MFALNFGKNEPWQRPELKICVLFFGLLLVFPFLVKADAEVLDSVVLVLLLIPLLLLVLKVAFIISDIPLSLVTVVTSLQEIELDLDLLFLVAIYFAFFISLFFLLETACLTDHFAISR